MLKKTAALIGLIIATLIWAINGVVYYEFIALGFSAVLILWIIRLFRFIAVWFISDFKGVKHELIKDKKELTFVLLNGIFAFLTPLFFVFALMYTKLSNVYFITYSAPAWVMIGAFFFLKEKINVKKIAGLLLTIAGIFMIASPENIFSLDTGVIFSLLCAIFYAGDIITGRELKDYPLHTVSIYSNGFSFIGLSLLLPFSFKVPAFEHELFYFAIIGLIVLGLLRGLASDLYYYALEKLDASTASIISLVELIFASLFAVIFFAQFPTVKEIAGYILIMASALIIILRKSDIKQFEYLLHLKRHH